MEFKYFKQPELYASLTDKEAECEFCLQKKHCISSAIYGDPAPERICLECIGEGKLYNTDAFTCEGDIAALKTQLRMLNPEWKDRDTDKEAESKTLELIKTTPPLVSWQDWDWPAADGDYCQFLTFGSKPFFNALDPGGDGKTLFHNSLYFRDKETSDTQYLWDDVMPDKLIKNFKESNQYSCLFYIFKSLNSSQIITLWDCD